MAKPTPEQLDPEHVALIKVYHAAKLQAAEAQRVERELRAQIVADCFGVLPDELREGTERRQVEERVTLKLVSKIEHKFVNQDAVDAVLDAMAQDPEGAVYAKQIVRVKYELSVSAYKTLPARFRKMIDQIVESRSGSPTLEVEIK